MKYLKQLSVILILIFNFKPLWAVEKEKLDQFKGTILGLYHAKMDIYKRILAQTVKQDREPLFEKFRKNSREIINYISGMSFLEFEELFEAAWTNKNEEVRNSGSWNLNACDVNEWYHFRVESLANYSESMTPTSARFIVLIADGFHPCFHFLDENSKK